MAKDALRFLGDVDGELSCKCNILDKDTSVFNYVQYMLDRTNRMFRYTNLPETIPEYLLEYMLQAYGSVAILKHRGDLYAFRCYFGGPYDPYYRPTQAVVANPALGLTGTYRIANYFPPFDKSAWERMPPCIRFINDSQIQGLIPLFSRYATQMAENDVSIRSAQINLRQQSLIVADTGPEIESAESYIRNLEAGKLSSINKRPFFDSVKLLGGAQGQQNTVIQLIELQQYLKASWYNEIGLNSNFNMKRQYMSADEVNSSADIMLPLIDNMFNSRLRAVEEINKEFGTNISVEKDSAWEKKQIQSDISTSLDPSTGDLTQDSSVDETNEEVADNIEVSESKDVQDEVEIPGPGEGESSERETDSDSGDVQSISESETYESIYELIDDIASDVIEEVIEEVMKDE